jgi:DNA-binding NarL/FixJ family response regulator
MGGKWLPSTEPRPRSRDDSLTSRQITVLRLTAEGLNSRQIADRLGISNAVVNWHFQEAYWKLGLKARNKVSAVMEAKRLGLLV